MNDQMLHHWAKATFFSSFLLLAGNDQALGQDFLSDTLLLDVYMGSHRSSVAKYLSNGGYELSGGGYVDFQDWYTPKLPDTTFLLLKQVSPDFGVIWGVSTGERGEKYRILPALQLGFVYQYVPFENFTFSIKATYPIFGKMTEKTCSADYGDLGGVQTVNCRLAASNAPPEETLNYLVNIKGEADAKINVSFRYLF